MAGQSWTNSATRPVLRFLDETEMAFSRSGLIYNLQHWREWPPWSEPPSRATIDRALRGLRENDLVDRPDGSLYAINDRGRAWLAGELEIRE